MWTIFTNYFKNILNGSKQQSTVGSFSRLSSGGVIFILILLSPLEAFSIYDQVALDIAVQNSKISISFTPDYNQTIKKFTSIYVAALIGSDIYFVYKNQGNLALEKFNPGIEPPFFSDEYGTEAVFLPEIDTQLLSNIQFFAGTGSSLTDMAGNGNIVCFYDGQTPQLPQPERKWTVMVYMVGSNLEGELGSKKRNASSDIMQMIQGSASLSSDTANVVLTTGGSKRKGWESVKRSWIHNGQYHHIEDMGNLNMGNPDTLSNFVIWAKEQFPAEHYALIMWSHGKGIRGFGGDANHAGDVEGSDLVFSKLNEAFTTIREGIGIPLDILLYDACLMGTIEVAELVSKVADTMGSSANTEPGFGFDYKALLQEIETKQISTGIDFGKTALDAYILECSKNGQFQSTATAITYSVLDLTKLSAFNEKFDLLSNEFLDIMKEASYKTYADLSKGLIRTTSYPLRSMTGAIDPDVPYFSIDLIGFFENIGEKIPVLKERTNDLSDIIMRELVVQYQGNINILEGVNDNAGRITIDVGQRGEHIKNDDDTLILPESYDKMNQAMLAYYAERKLYNNMINPSINCPPGNDSCAADPNWLELPRQHLINANVLICQSSDGMEQSSKEILHLKQIYNGESLETDREYPVFKEDICAYSLCMDGICELITVKDFGNNTLTAEAIVNGSQAILTFTNADAEKNEWRISSVTDYSDETWGKSENIMNGDTITPTVSRLVNNDTITKYSGNSINVKDSARLLLTKKCIIDFPAVAASFLEFNGKIRYETLCNDVMSCFSSEDNRNIHPGIVIQK